MKEVNKQMEVKMLQTSPYYPQTNGLTERLNNVVPINKIGTNTFPTLSLPTIKHMHVSSDENPST